jgi:hypothetical protein
MTENETRRAPHLPRSFELLVNFARERRIIQKEMAKEEAKGCQVLRISKVN